jgi:hypothetical protein
MHIQEDPIDAAEIEKFRLAHIAWKSASDHFHDRFQAILTCRTVRASDLEYLGEDLAGKLNEFIECTKELARLK